MGLLITKEIFIRRKVFFTISKTHKLCIYNDDGWFDDVFHVFISSVNNIPKPEKEW